MRPTWIKVVAVVFLMMPGLVKAGEVATPLHGGTVVVHVVDGDGKNVPAGTVTVGLVKEPVRSRGIASMLRAQVDEKGACQWLNVTQSTYCVTVFLTTKGFRYGLTLPDKTPDLTVEEGKTSEITITMRGGPSSERSGDGAVTKAPALIGGRTGAMPPRRGKVTPPQRPEAPVTTP